MADAIIVDYPASSNNHCFWVDPVSRDLYLAKIRDTARNLVEVHCWRKANGYASPPEHHETPVGCVSGYMLPRFSPTFDLFLFTPDLSNNTTLIQISTAQSSYRNVREQRSRGGIVAGSNWDFAIHPDGDVWGFLKAGTTSTELHVLGGPHYDGTVLDVSTPCPRTANNTQISLGSAQSVGIWGVYEFAGGYLSAKAYSTDGDHRFLAEARGLFGLTDGGYDTNTGNDLFFCVNRQSAIGKIEVNEISLAEA